MIHFQDTNAAGVMFSRVCLSVCPVLTEVDLEQLDMAMLPQVYKIPPLHSNVCDVY